MTIDQRIETLAARHETLTMNVELMQAAQAENHAWHDHEMADIRSEGRKTRDDLRRWAALGVKEGRTHRKRITELETKAAEYRAHTDQNLAEITDKLNGLIGHVDGSRNGEPEV